ncbi:hypothetical protein AB0N89_06675 [Amycolatopsis sp. NPDC089917]|uniref:hypothetical protein n=1 Tax=Amycolatopsis sp. NPDC089917 TaxID=3155187 RepID=UPI0034194772
MNSAAGTVSTRRSSSIRTDESRLFSTVLLPETVLERGMAELVIDAHIHTDEQGRAGPSRITSL